MPAIIIVVLMGALVAGILGVDSGTIGFQNVRETLAQQHLVQSYQAAQTGLREAIAYRFAYSTNKLNFITPASGQTPYNPLSGWVHSDPSSPVTGNRLAAYRFMVFGGAPERTSAGALDSSRADVYDSVLPVYVVSRGTSCLDGNHTPIEGDFTVDANGVVGCSTGDVTNVTLLAKLDLSGSTNSITWTRVFTDNTTMTTDESVFVPGYGYVTSFAFDTAWLGGSTRTTQSSGLYRMVVDDNGTVSSYDLTGLSSIAIPDGSYSTRLSETNTEFKFVFNGPIDFRTLYPTSDYDNCFTGAGTQCNITVQRDSDASPDYNAKIYPVFPFQNQVVVDGDFSSYTHSSLSTHNSQYLFTIPSNTIYDWYGNPVNAGSAFTTTFKVPDVPIPDCSVAESVTISSGLWSPFTYNDSSKAYTITVAAGVNDIEMTIDNTCTNSVTLTDGTNDDITINNGSSSTLTVTVPSEGNDEIIIDNDNTAGGSLTVNLPGESGAYTVTGTPPAVTHYNMNCEDADVYVTGVQTISYGSYTCCIIINSGSPSASWGTPSDDCVTFENSAVNKVWTDVGGFDTITIEGGRNNVVRAGVGGDIIYVNGHDRVTSLKHEIQGGEGNDVIYANDGLATICGDGLEMGPGYGTGDIVIFPSPLIAYSIVPFSPSSPSIYCPGGVNSGLQVSIGLNTPGVIIFCIMGDVETLSFSNGTVDYAYTYFSSDTMTSCSV